MQGRIRTRISLTDGGEDPLAEITMRATRRGLRSRTVRAEVDARDGTEWTVLLTDALDAEVRRGGPGGPLVLRAAEGRVRIGDRDLEWTCRSDGSRRAVVRDERRRPLLDVSPGTGRRDPWAVLAVDRELPEPLPVALAACAVLLRADALLRPWPDTGASP